VELTQRRTKAPRRGAYLLPSLFTVANIFCGFFAVTEALKGGGLMVTGMTAEAATHFDAAAKAIGFAVLFDGMDGRVARLMGTTSEFGREFDSLADITTFGIAPAVLAFAWGVQAVLPNQENPIFAHLTSAAWLFCFVFVISSAARLARFNIQTGPGAPRRVDHKNFVGLPTPAAAGLVAAVVHVSDGNPVGEWLWVPFWLVVLLGTSFLMVSTWRYHSFKDLDLKRKRRFAVVIGVACIGALIWFYSEIMLLLIAVGYVVSGVTLKLSHLFRRPRIEPHPEERKI
jgi:CDP-diacylglycerol--serine O-phosphatidyltransferase